MKNLLVFLKKDKFNLVVAILSFVILGLGWYLFSWWAGLIAFVLVNLIWVIPFIQWNSKLEKREKVRELKGEDVTLERRDEDLAKKGKKSSKKSDKKSLRKKILLGFMIFFLVCIVLAIIFFAYIALTAGKFDPDKLYSKEASTLIDVNGNTYAKLGSEMRQKISYDDMSEELINAIVATEDSRFFEHNGFDLPRFVKASFGQLLGQDAGGASTLTMQVSKNQYTSNVATGWEGIKRKFTDIYISMFQIEMNYSKEEILEFYANSYYLGSGAYGVEQAAQTYFNKSADELNLAEAAMIAGLFQSPVSYDPNINPDRTEARRQTVLSLMKRHGYITDEEYEIAKDMTVDKIVIKGNSSTTDNAQYRGFINAVAEEVEDKTGYNPYQYSMKIYTTMDKEKQDVLNDIMDGTSYNWENDVVQAGVVAIDNKTGGISAISNGRNQNGETWQDFATGSGGNVRQIGSTAKPLFDYGPAIEYNNWNTDHPIIDTEHTYSDGTPVNNWDGTYKGIITMRQALVESRNVPAVKTFQSVDNEKIKDFVTSLGLHPGMDSNGKLYEADAIGGYNGEYPLSVAGAYSAFANGGYYIEPHTVTKIKFDETGKVEEYEPERTKVMSAATAYMITDMLVDTAENALGRYSNINGATYAAKTGTSNYDEKTQKTLGLPDNAVNDLWVAGYNPDYSIAVWYGYASNSSKYYNRFGSAQNSRLFNAVAKNFFKADAQFEKPSEVVEVTVERNTGTSLLPSENTPDSAKTTELFRESTKPTEVSARFNTLGNVSNLKANVSGNKATISWSGISTPEALSQSYWKPFVEKAFGLTKDQNSYLSYIMNYNSSVLGNVVYKVYYKNGNDLTLLTTTSETSTTVRLPNVDSPTIVVKTGYSNYSGCDSSGVETKVNYDATSASDVKATLNGSSSAQVDLGSNYVDPSNPVKVTLNGEDITNSDEVDVTLTVTDATGTVVNNWKSVIGTVEGVYTFSYKVTYDGEEVTTLEKTVTVKAKGEA